MRQKFILLNLVIFLCGALINLYGQNFETPQWNSPKTHVWVPGGNYVSLPIQNIVTQNTETKFVRTPHELLVISPNYRPFPASATESDISCFQNSANSNIVFVSWNSYYPSWYGTGFCVTTNTGNSWTGAISLNGPPVNGGDPSSVILPNGYLVLNALNLSDSQVVTCRSTDNGSTWSGYSIVGISGSEDRNFLMLDRKTSSPYYGYLYCGWTDLGGTTWPGKVARSTDNGLTWSTPVQVTVPISGYFSGGVNLQTGPNGEVYYFSSSSSTYSPYIEWYIAIGKSTNAGQKFTINERAIPIDGIRGTIKTTGIRVNSFPSGGVDISSGPRNGWVYVCWAQRYLAPAGNDPDICFARSTDGGSSWNTPVRVNNDPLNNGRDQWMPWLSVDDSGGVNIIFYDSRNPTTNDSAEVYLARSLDGGTSWVNTLISDHRFKPAPIAGLASGYQGDYIGISSGHGMAFPMWADNSSGIYQLWSSHITFAPPPAHDISVGPFLSLPYVFIINSNYSIKTRVQNVGSSNEIGVPIRFYINGTLTNSYSINLNSGQVDSVSYSWTPTLSGPYTLKYISALATDSNHTNDTVQTNVTVFTSSGPLCEGFNSTTFPPVGWNVVYTGTNYWSRCTCSGFNTGSGSAKYDCWNAPNGTNQDLITITFNSVFYFDTLKFDLAYCPYGTTDSLIVLASTNSGTTYTPVARMGGSGMGTVTACSRPFTPSTSSEWTFKRIGMPQGTNKIDFLGKSGYGDSFYIDSICMPMDDVIVNNEKSIATAYSLSQNYPNPFNPVTRIEYSIPKESKVKFTIYDTKGAEVYSITNGNQHVGNYTVIFNGEKLASGVYFYKLEATSLDGTGQVFSAVKKMVIIK